MSKADDLPEAIARQVALTSAPLTADCAASLVIPAAQRLDSAALHNRHGVDLELVLRPHLLDAVQSEVQRDGSREKRQQGILLQLVSEDWRVARTLRSHGEARVGVAERDGERHLAG
eukprot:389648_1